MGRKEERHSDENEKRHSRDRKREREGGEIPVKEADILRRW